MAKRKGFTTMVDLEEFKATTWSYLTNVKMVWQYEGMANLFRRAGIPLYGFDQGTMKMNHPVMGLAIPQSKDKNYGVDIYVPVSCKKEALAIIADEEALREAADREAEEGPCAHAAFDREARASMAANKKRRREEGRSRRQGLAGRVRALCARA